MQPYNLNQLIRQEDWDNVVSLIEAGADIHVAGSGGFTPLMQAVDVGSLELVDYLLLRGVFINFVGREGNTALHVAVSAAIESKKQGLANNNRALAMLRLLLARGADVKKCNDAGESALDWAKAAFAMDVVAELEGG